MTHVFVCFGAISLWAASRVVEARQLDPAEVYVFSTAPVSRNEFPEGTTISVMDPRPSDLTEWQKPFALARFTTQCLKHLAGKKSYVLYAPHVFEMPANVLAFDSQRVVRREMLPDGLANYLPRPLIPEGVRKKAGFVARISLRKLAARSAGMEYRVMTSGDITQYDKGIWAATHTFDTMQLVTRAGALHKLELLPLSARAPRAGKGCLIVDQEIGEIADQFLEQRLRRALSKLLQESSPPLLYKPHPRGLDRAGEHRASGLFVEPAPSGLAEHVALQQNAGMIVGFYSTALLFLAESSIRRVAVLPTDGAKGLRRPTYVREIKKILRSTGAEVIEVP